MYYLVYIFLAKSALNKVWAASVKLTASRKSKKAGVAVVQRLFSDRYTGEHNNECSGCDQDVEADGIDEIMECFGCPNAVHVECIGDCDWITEHDDETQTEHYLCSVCQGIAL